jgi:maleate cis-trans isomerase
VTHPPLRLGLLYPGDAAEDDLPWLVESLFPDGSVIADVVHTSMDEDAHDVELLDLGSARRLHVAADTLRDHGAAVAVWACTSGSFVFGWEGAQRQAADLEAAVGKPVLTANQVSVWEALRLAGHETPPRAGFGTLFAHSPAGARR